MFAVSGRSHANDQYTEKSSLNLKLENVCSVRGEVIKKRVLYANPRNKKPVSKENSTFK